MKTIVYSTRSDFMGRQVLQVVEHDWTTGRHQLRPARTPDRAHIPERFVILSIDEHSRLLEREKRANAADRRAIGQRNAKIDRAKIAAGVVKEVIDGS